MKIPCDSEYEIAQFPTCKSFSLNNEVYYKLITILFYQKVIPGVLKCETSDSDVLITGLENDLAAESEYALLLSLKNPPFKGTTDNFKIRIFRGNTTVVYDWDNEISGVSILAG